MDLLVSFLKWALPLVPGLAPKAVQFWGENNLGPMPPDLEAWAKVDAKTDARLAEESKK